MAIRGVALEVVVPERGVVPRANAGRPICRSPRRSRQYPSATIPASPRRFASVANSSPNTARSPPFVAITSTSPGLASASAVITGRWSSVGDDRERRPGHPDVGDHRMERGIDDGQRLVGVRERRDVDREQPVDELHGGRAWQIDREATVASPGYRRWLIPPAALAVHLSIGQVYAFSVFKEPLVEHFDTAAAGFVGLLSLCNMSGRIVSGRFTRDERAPARRSPAAAAVAKEGSHR